MFNNSIIVQSTPGQITANNWFHVAVTRTTKKQINLYINGNNVGTVPENGDCSALGTVDFFNGTNSENFFFTNLRVVTQTAIYPTESVVLSYPTYPLNKSYDDTAMLVLGKREFQFEQDYSDNNVTFSTFEGSPFFDPETDSPINLIVDGTVWDVNPWTTSNAEDAMINLINGHPKRINQPYFTGIDAAVEWAFEIETSPILFSNIDYFDVDFGIPYLLECVMLLDSGYISSYPLVRNRHYNLRKFDTYGEIDNGVTYEDALGGRLLIPKGGSGGTYGIRYNISTVDLSSFTYYGILSLGATSYGNTYDLVGCYNGVHNWRVQRTNQNQGTLYVTDGSNVEQTLGTFVISPGIVSAGYFSLTVMFDNSSNFFQVLLNNVDVLNGYAFLSRPTGTGSGGYFIVDDSTKDKMAHYVSSIWPYGNSSLANAIGMNDSFNSGRYPGIV
jgi:hypothetical protein